MNMANTSLHISLSEALKQDALKQAEDGRFSNPTEYIRHLIRQDVLRANAQAEFSSFIKKGMESPSCNQSPKEMIAELKAQINLST